MTSWTRHYDAGIPASLAPYPARTLLDYVRDTTRATPTAPAVIFKGRTLSYQELDRLSSAFAASLTAMGFGKGDRLALVLPNCPQFLIAELGAWKAGAVVLPLNPLYTEHELVEPLRESEARAAVVLTPFYERVTACRSRTSLTHIIATNIKEFLPPAVRWLFTVFKEKSGGHRIRIHPGDRWFGDLLRQGAGRPVAAAAPHPEDAAIMLMSGGTTGTPKAVIGLHRSLVAAGLQLNAWLAPPAGARPDIALLPLPLFHVYACVGGQSHAFVARTPLALVPNPRDLDDLLATIERVRPTLFSAVPALFVALLNHPKVKARNVNLGSIRACFSGAAPLLAETKKRFEELTGGRIVEGYSLTEAMMACVVNPLNGVNKAGSVGVPLPDVEVAIVDTERGETVLAAGQVGEVILRAPQLMPGYLNHPEETAKVLRAHGAGAPWLHTGDLGHLDADGYLFIVDRMKDLIKISGYQVWPREIEEALATHPAVADVGVAGVLDAAKGEIVKAWVVRRDGENVTAEELREYCRGRLAPFKIPAQIEFRKELPKTMAGKVLRRALVAEG